jgi:hypothetical protein
MVSPRDFCTKMAFRRNRVFELSQGVGKVAGKITKVFVKDEIPTLRCFPCPLKMRPGFPEFALEP